MKNIFRKSRKYKIGIVLSGGGARGFAHVGVLKALNEKGIYPDVISGVSAGSIAGAFYADGYKPDDILNLFIETKLFEYVRFNFPHRGFGSLKGLEKILKQYLRATSFEELKIPLYISVTDLNNAKIVYFSKGELQKVIIASSSIPVLFNPVEYNNITYVDGGVINNFPLEPIENQCNKIIGVYLNPISYQKEFKTMISIAERSFHLSMMTNVVNKSQKLNLFIKLDGLGKYGTLNVARGKEIFEIGYNATKKLLSKRNDF